MNSKASKTTSKSSLIVKVLLIVFTLLFLVTDVSAGVWAAANYASGMNISDSGSSVGISGFTCTAVPSDGSRNAAHRLNGGSLIEPNHQLVIIQIILLVLAVGLTLGLIRYRDWQYRAVVLASLVIVLIIEFTMFSEFHSAVSMLCMG
jgi:hypothetical protein